MNNIDAVSPDAAQRSPQTVTGRGSEGEVHSPNRHDDAVSPGPTTMYLVKRLETMLRSHMEPIARSAGLTVAQFTALSILQARPGISSAELARRTFVSAQAANELVNGLTTRGLVLRRRSPEHGKILLLRLSKRGEALITKCAASMQELEDLMLSALGDEDSQCFNVGLRSCIAALEAETRR